MVVIGAFAWWWLKLWQNTVDPFVMCNKAIARMEIRATPAKTPWTFNNVYNTV